VYGIDSPFAGHSESMVYHEFGRIYIAVDVAPDRIRPVIHVPTY
jgi:hypothetical protein